MRCHEVDYEIFGSDLQIVEIILDPGESVVAEAGSMNYMKHEWVMDLNSMKAFSGKSSKRGNACCQVSHCL